MNKSILQIKEVCKNFENGKQTLEVLKKINLDVEKGEFISVMGQSGCGKSTLLYIIGGLDSPTKGKIMLDGKNIADMSDKEKLRELLNEGVFANQCRQDLRLLMH